MLGITGYRLAYHSGITKIEDHIDYLMIRVDPDEVMPLKGESESKEYLSKPAHWGD